MGALGAAGYHAAAKVLLDHKPHELEMWLQLAAQQFPALTVGGAIFPLLAPYHGTLKKPDFVERCEERTWKSKDMSFLEYLRKANKQSKPTKFIAGALKKHFQVKPKSKIAEIALEEFARGCKTQGERSMLGHSCEQPRFD